MHFALSRGRTIRRRENSSVTCFQSHVKIRTNSMDYSVPGNSATKETLITTSPCYPLFRKIDQDRPKRLYKEKVQLKLVVQGKSAIKFIQED